MADRIFAARHPVREILRARRASGSLPGKRDDPHKVGLAIEGGTTTFRGSRAVDGAVLRRHPFATARADGCTHVLSLSTRPIRPINPRIQLRTRLVSRYPERLEPGLGDGYLTAVSRDLTEDKPFMAESRLRPGGHPAVLDVAPLPGTPEVRRHEMSFGALLQGARTAYRTVHLALEDEDVQVVPRLMVYRPR